MTFQSLYQNLATWLGLETTGTGLLTERKAWVNDAYRDVVGAFDWPTKYAYDVVQTSAKEDTSTLQAAIAGATAIVANAAVWNTGWTKRKIRIEGEVYDITAFGTTSTATLADGLIAAISAGTAYVLYQNEYALPADCAEVVEIWPYNQSYPTLQKGDLWEWGNLQAQDWRSASVPRWWFPLGASTAGVLQFGVHPIPNGILNLHVHYLKALTALSADADVPSLLPPQAQYLVGKRAKVYAFEHNRETGLQDRAIGDYETCLAKELNRLDPTSGYLRLDAAVFGHDSADWVDRLKYDGRV